MAYLIGIDCGSSAIKVGLYNTKGSLQFVCSKPYKLRYPQPGWVDIPADELWGILVQLISTLLEESRICPQDVAGLGFSNFCPALVLLDKDGEALRPIINFMDQRSQKQLNRIKDEAGETEFFAITGNGLNMGCCSLSNLLWVKEEQPEVYKRTSFIGHLNTYLTAKMTGNYGVDYTNASMIGLFNMREKKWSHEICGLFGINPNILPPLYHSGDMIGRLKKQVAAELGLLEGTPVAMGAADTACSALALKLNNERDCFESAGTSDVLTFCNSKPDFDKRFVNRFHILPGLWLSHGAMSTPGATMSWIKERFFQYDSKKLNDNNLYELISQEAAKAKPGSGGIIFLPYMMGERTPIWDGNARGTFIGLSLASTNGDIFRAVMEGTGFGLRQILDIMQFKTGLLNTKITAVGGCANNLVWSQIKADILNKEIQIMDIKDTALMGAAFLGGKAGGFFKNYDEVIEASTLRVKTTVKPDCSKGELYKDLYKIYNDMYLILKNKYKQLSDFKVRYY